MILKRTRDALTWRHIQKQSARDARRWMNETYGEDVMREHDRTTKKALKTLKKNR